MKSTSCLKSSRRPVRHIGRVVANCAVLIALIALPLTGQTVGSINSHTIPAMGIAVIDEQQNVYIARGGGCAGGFGAPLTCYPFGVVKADATGSTMYSYSDKTPSTSPRAIAVDSQGQALVTGSRLSTGGFVAKVSADGSRLLYFTQLPSSLLSPQAVQTDSDGNAYIAGMTSDFHPFVTKLSADGSRFLYTTRFSGSAASSATPDPALALAVDSSGQAFVTGWTNSSDFPITRGALQTTLMGPVNAFVAKLDVSGSIVFSTFLGGAGGAYGKAIQLDSGGHIYVAGVAGSGFSTTPGTYQPVPVIPLWSLGTTGFVARLAPTGASIDWATYTVSDGVPPTAANPGLSPIELVASATGEIYLATGTRSGFVSTPSAPQPCFSGAATDAVLLHLSSQGVLADSSYLGADAAPFGMSLLSDGSVLIATATIDPKSLDYLPQLDGVVFGQGGWSATACLSPRVLNAANFTVGMSPGEVVSLTGYGIGPETGIVYQPGPNGEVPTSLGGVTVSFNGISAPLTYVHSRQVNAQVPFEVTGPTVSVTLTYGDSAFGPIVQELSPFEATQGLFRLQPGVSTLAAAVNMDGTINGHSNPAARGSVVSLYGTGYGPLQTPCATGGLNPSEPILLTYARPAVTSPTASVSVLYQGAAPTLLCGIEQFNVVVPQDAPLGELLLTVGAAGQYNGSTIFVK